MKGLAKGPPGNIQSGHVEYKEPDPVAGSIHTVQKVHAKFT